MRSEALCASGQPYGSRAKQYASELAFGKVVTVEPVDRDQCDRLVADVIWPDGRSLNAEMVRAGYAWWYRRYSRDPELAKLEAEAREARRPGCGGRRRRQGE
jgi:micrococcal nuclease